MIDSFTSSSDKAGLPPGSLVHIGEVIESNVKISVTSYNAEKIEERQIQSVDELLPYKDSKSVTWVVIEGLTNIDLIEQIGNVFNIHQLVLEDILNTHQRPKFEEYDGYLYIVLKSIFADKQQCDIAYEQISLILVDNFVIVFKEKQDSLFKPLQRRITKSKGQIRNYDSDYLAYEVLDTVVDQYFNVIDSLDEAIVPLEEHLLASELNQDVLATIQRLNREIIQIRRYASPVRELMAEMLRSDSDLIHDKTRIYLRDVSDHALRVVESIESYRDILTNLLAIYMSGISNKMNEVMKVLAIFASIFVPLTFIAGVYGMNFQNMPELKLKWAYPGIWLLFLSVAGALLVYFKRKKWF